MQIGQHGTDAAIVVDGSEPELGEDVADIVLSAIWEAVVYAATAALLGAVATALDGMIVAAALGLALPVVAFGIILLTSGGGFVLVVAATLVPALAALRHEIPHTLAVE